MADPASVGAAEVELRWPCGAKTVNARCALESVGAIWSRLWATATPAPSTTKRRLEAKTREGLLNLGKTRHRLTTTYLDAGRVANSVLLNIRLIFVISS